MDIEQHVREYQRIIKTYHLDNEQKATEIADYLTTRKDGAISAQEFASLFALSVEDAAILLSFIEKALDFRKYLHNKE